MDGGQKFIANLKTIFQKKNLNSVDEDSSTPKSISLLSVLANSVIARCSRILKVSTEELQKDFDAETPQSSRKPTIYARNLMEFSSYKALNVLSNNSEYMSNKDFRRLTFDMMLAWENPGPEADTGPQIQSYPDSPEAPDDDGWSLFYSNSTDMAVQVDEKKTVGPEAFARIAPGCAAIADIITAHNLFDALTSSTGNRLHFLIYDKYLQSLDKVIKTAKNVLGALSNLELYEGETVLDVEGGVPTQPVLQHIGISAWPGRVTLTTKALYFESLGVGTYDKATRYDLAEDLKQVLKPELTGPLGARLFDKAVMYKSASVAEPVHFEFPEFKGNTRRDYWLDICLEILRANKFARKHDLKGIQWYEVMARAVLGLLRCRAVKEAFHVFASNYKTLLLFNLTENLPGGDVILETLSKRLALQNANATQGRTSTQQQLVEAPVSFMALQRLGLIVDDTAELNEESSSAGYVYMGEPDTLETAVKKSKSNTGKAEAAQATVDQVKVDGIDTNIAVMKELLFPFIFVAERYQGLASWTDPVKSAFFMLLMSYTILSGWVKFILPSILLFVATIMLWRRHFNKGRPIRPFRIVPPPNRNTVEQLLTLQEAVSQVEALIQSGNIVLLKIRALLFAVLPQATERVALLLVVAAAVLAFVPLRFIFLWIILEAYTREMPVRRHSSYKWIRRVREWWFRIPAAPVQLMKPDPETKKKK